MRPDRLALVAGLLLAAPAFAQSPQYHLGRTPTPAEVDAWNIDVLPDGTGLPPGHGSVAEGQAVFADNCAACHGEKGQKGAADRLVGGIGTLKQHDPVRTVGSYWPYATTLYDFIHRAMPFSAPESLSPNQVYAVVAYLLSLNGIVPDDAVLDAKSLPKVVMPNRNGFVRAGPGPDLP